MINNGNLNLFSYIISPIFKQHISKEKQCFFFNKNISTLVLIHQEVWSQNFPKLRHRKSATKWHTAIDTGSASGWIHQYPYRWPSEKTWLNTNNTHNLKIHRFKGGISLRDRTHPCTVYSSACWPTSPSENPAAFHEFSCPQDLSMICSQEITDSYPVYHQWTTIHHPTNQQLTTPHIDLVTN